MSILADRYNSLPTAGRGLGWVLRFAEVHIGDGVVYMGHRFRS